MFAFLKKKRIFPGIEPDTPIVAAPYVVIDTELTGLDEKKDSIVSIGAVRMAGGKIEMGNTFSRLVSPRSELSAASVVIHEITPSEAASKPQIDAVLAEFLDYAGDAVLAGHFVSIDLAFLNREMKRLYDREIQNPVIDTFSLYVWLRKRRQSHDRFASLYDIARYYGVPVNGAHNAVMDAFTTAQLLQRFFPLLAEAGVIDIESLLRIGMPFEGGDQFRLTNEFSNF